MGKWYPATKLEWHCVYMQHIDTFTWFRRTMVDKDFNVFITWYGLLLPNIETSGMFIHWHCGMVTQLPACEPSHVKTCLHSSWSVNQVKLNMYLLWTTAEIVLNSVRYVYKTLHVTLIILIVLSAQAHILICTFSVVCIVIFHESWEFVVILWLLNPFHCSTCTYAGFTPRVPLTLRVVLKYMYKSMVLLWLIHENSANNLLQSLQGDGLNL